MPKRQLAIETDLAINRNRFEAKFERKCEAFDVDDDAPYVLSADP